MSDWKPPVIRRLHALGRVLGKDVDEVRVILRSLLGEIIVKPTPEAELEERTGA